MSEPMSQHLYNVEHIPLERVSRRVSEDVNYDVETPTLWRMAGEASDNVCETVKDAIRRG